MNKFNISSWENFRRLISKPVTRKNGNMTSVCESSIYRGHSNTKWKLASSIERRLCIGNSDQNYKLLNGKDWYKKICEDHLEKFKKYTHGHSELVNCTNDIDVWSIGRHYGLLSPFLDWTESPYIAVFFGLEKIFEILSTPGDKNTILKGYFHVWRINLWPELQERDDFKCRIPSRKFGTRQFSQKSVFTLLDNYEYFEIEKFFKKHDLDHCLDLFVIPNDISYEIIIDLINMNISFSTMYPGIEGAALESNFASEWLPLLHSLKQNMKNN